MTKQNSNIENAIQNLEDYIESARPAPLSHTKIVVEKEDIEYLIADLRSKIPEEVERFRKVISNKEAIERDARVNAEQLMNEAKNKSYELLSENEIMLKANEEADQIVNLAAKQAQDIIDAAIIESNNYKEQAKNYLNDMMVNLYKIIYNCIDATANNTNKLLDALNEVGMTVSNNLDSLNGVENNIEATSEEEIEDK